MRKWVRLVTSALFIVAVVMFGSPSGASQTPALPQTARTGADRPDDSLLHWKLPPGAEKYAAMDGKRIHQIVSEVVEVIDVGTIQLDRALRTLQSRFRHRRLQGNEA